jgi:hypothetical protein
LEKTEFFDACAKFTGEIAAVFSKKKGFGIFAEALDISIR